MTDRIAIKRLTPSDCTLFEGVFKKNKAGNQKGINLNADVLTGELFPSLTAAVAGTENQIQVSISLYGPGTKGPHILSRKIIKNATYKNWRLNGEFISGPLGDSARYDEIQPEDFAVMVFKGEIVPTGIDLIIVSQTSAADILLHKALGSLFTKARSMIRVTPAQVAEAASSAGVPESHPINIAAADPELETALEDAVSGGIDGTKKLLKNKGGKKISAADLLKAKTKAELTGLAGEGLVNGYLEAKVHAGELVSTKWASIENAVEPYDFDIQAAPTERILIDVKTTSGPFENVIHVSLAEIIAASEGLPYHIYRVFEINEDGGKLRISDDIRPLAQSLKKIHEMHIPPGIRVDGFSIKTSALEWGQEEYIKRQDEAT